MANYMKPLPIMMPYEKPFWEGAKERQVLLQRCKNCKHIIFPTNSWCPDCHADEIEWFQASGKGTIFSRIVYHQAFQAGFADDLPYNVVWVRLDEGPLFTSNIVGFDKAPNQYQTLKPGTRVEAVFEDINDEVTLIKFKIVK